MEENFKLGKPQAELEILQLKPNQAQLEGITRACSPPHCKYVHTVFNRVPLSTVISLEGLQLIALYSPM